MVRSFQLQLKQYKDFYRLGKTFKFIFIPADARFSDSNERRMDNNRLEARTLASFIPSNDIYDLKLPSKKNPDRIVIYFL